MAAPEVPTSERVKTTQDSHRRRSTRIRSNRDVRQHRILTKATMRRNNRVAVQSRLLTSHSVPAREIVLSNPNPTNISLDRNISEETAAEIIRESADTVKIPPVFEDAWTERELASQGVAESSSQALLPDIEVMSRSLAENYRRSSESLAGAWTRHVAVSSSQALLPDIEVMSRSLAENYRRSSESLAEAWTRHVAVSSSQALLPDIEVMSRSLAENYRRSSESLAEAWTRHVAVSSSQALLPDIEVMSRSLAENYRRSSESLAEAWTWTTSAFSQIGIYDRRAILLAKLKLYNQAQVADRIQEYLEIRDQEPDEPPIAVESLRSLVTFIIQEPSLLPSIIGSDPRGQMEIEWHLQDNGDPSSVWGRGRGVVSLRFLLSGDIQYVALSGPFRKEQERLRIHGRSTKEDIIADLREFAERVTTS